MESLTNEVVAFIDRNNIWLRWKKYYLEVIKFLLQKYKPFVF